MDQNPLDRFSSEDRTRLNLFRRVAAQIQPLFVKHHAHRFQVRFFQRAKPDEADLIPHSDFQALGLLVRLAYLDREPGNLNRVANILARVPDSVLRDEIKVIKDAWKRNIKGWGLFSIDHHSYDGEDVLDVWLNAKVFHQDEHKQEDLRRLEKLGIFASYTLQVNVLRMVGCILALDAVVAQRLEEDPLPFEPLEEVSHPFGEVRGAT